jgi:purine-binding chemotaxis protein CheW
MPASAPAKLVTARVGNRTVGIDIMAVRKILPYTAPTVLPHQAAHILGVINLRGTVVPVFDLAARLGWERSNDDSRSVMIVTEAGGRNQAMLVDAEGDIVELDPADVQPAPSIDGVASRFVSGLVETGEKNDSANAATRSMIVLLDSAALALAAE